MNDYISIRNQYCPNAACRFHKKVMAENVIMHSQPAGRMQCKACKKTWVAHRNEIHYGLKTDLQEINSAIELLRKGLSIRKTAKSIKVSTSTIQRIHKRMQKIISNP